MNGQLRVADEKGVASPDVAAMIDELSHACELSADRVDAMAEAENTRFCRWDGQQANGRKPKSDGVKPWPEASDTRVFLTDAVIRDQVALLKRVARKARLVARGTEGTDFRRAGKTQVYMDWLRDTRMRRNVSREVDLAANWRQTHGRAVMAVTWRQEWSRDYEEVSLGSLKQMAEQAPDSPVAVLMASLYQPEKEVQKALAKQLVQLYPDLTLAEAYRQLQRLRKSGRISLPVRYLRVNEPVWEALKPWRDVFYPTNTEELQRAPWVAWRCLLTPAAVDERRISEGWGEAFAEQVKASAGATVLDQAGVASELRRELFRDQEEEMSGLCEVFYFYYTATDAQGVPCQWRTVISPHVTKVNDVWPHGPDEPAGYDHGLYPFVELRAERPDRMLEESRGVPTVTATAQAEVKSHRDLRVDQTELALQPPLIRPEREVGLPLKIKPRGEIGERRSAAARFMAIPLTAPAAEPVEMAALKAVDAYFARNRAEDPVRASLHEEDLAEDFAEELGECWSQTLQLAQQFETDAVFNRVVGGRPVQHRVSRQDIQGAYDVRLLFSLDQLDPEKIKAKAQVLREMILPVAGGKLNLAPAVAALAAYYFPEFADEIVQGEEQADELEVKDEQTNWALLIAGEEPPMKEEGQNFALRLQWLQNKLAQPGAQQRMQMLPDAKEMVERRMKHLRFMTEQFGANAQAGRVGVLE